MYTAYTPVLLHSGAVLNVDLPMSTVYSSMHGLASAVCTLLTSTEDRTMLICTLLYFSCMEEPNTLYCAFSSISAFEHRTNMIEPSLLVWKFEDLPSSTLFFPFLVPTVDGRQLLIVN